MSDRSIRYIRAPLCIDGDVLRAALGMHDWVVEFDGIADVHGNNGRALLTFLSDPAFADVLNANPCITGVFCRESARSALRPGIMPLIVDDPKYAFFTVMDHVARTYCTNVPTMIGKGCSVARSATIAPTCVWIGDGVVVEPGAYVAPGTVIADGALIRANAAVGVDGFQHQRTTRGMVSPLHDGLLFVGRNVEIGYSASVSRGFSYRHTVIGDNVKLDSLSYVAHGTEIGANTIVCAHACVMGHVLVGEGAWLGPNCTVTSRVRVGNGAAVSLGAVVTKDVPAGNRYSGNFAIPHDRFIADLKRRMQ